MKITDIKNELIAYCSINMTETQLISLLHRVKEKENSNELLIKSLSKKIIINNF